MGLMRDVRLNQNRNFVGRKKQNNELKDAKMLHKARGTAESRDNILWIQPLSHYT